MAGRYHVEAMTVPGPLAGEVAWLVQLGVKGMRADGFRPGEDLAEWIGELVIYAKAGPGVHSSAFEQLPQQWVGTAEAARVIGVGERAMRLLAGRVVSRLVHRNRREWLYSDVLAEADARRGD